MGLPCPQHLHVVASPEALHAILDFFWRLQHSGVIDPWPLVTDPASSPFLAAERWGWEPQPCGHRLGSHDNQPPSLGPPESLH